MSRLFNRLVIAAVVSVTVLAGVSAAAVAQTSVTTRAALHEGFGRVVFDWPAAPEYQVKRDGRRLRVIFKESFTTSFDAVKQMLGDYISDIRVAEDGRTVELELAAELEFRAFSYDDKVIVDLMDPVSGAPETALQARDSDAGDKPEAPRDQVKVRIGEHPNFSRVVFDWPGLVDYRVSTDGGRTELRFNRPAEIDLSLFNAAPPKYFLSVEVKLEGDSTLVILVTEPSTRIRHFRVGVRIVVDALAAPASTKTEEAQEPKVAETQQAEVVVAEEIPAEADPATDVEESQSAIAPAEEQPEEEPANLVAEVSPVLPPAREEPATADDEPAAESTGEAVEEATEVASVTRPAEAVETTGMETTTVTSAQLTLGPPRMSVTVTNETNRSLLTFDAGKRISSAAFIRGDHLWVIFEEPFTIDLTAVRATLKTAYDMIEERNHDEATVLRLKLRKGFSASMRRRGIEWFLQISPSPQPPEAIEVRVTGDATRNQRVQLPLARIGDHILIRDPADRSTIDVVPVMASGSGINRLRRFSQFDLLATLQGVAIIGPGQIQVFTTLSGVEISARGDPATPELETVKQRAWPVTTLFELVAWRRGGEMHFAANRTALHRAIATATNKALGKARFDLARFLFAHGYMAEAYGVVELLVEMEPRRAENISLRAMRGVMNLAMNRVREAIGYLSVTVFDSYDDIALWRGVLAMKQGDINGAAAFFSQAGDLWLELPSPLRERVGLMSAEAILENNDLVEAKAHLDILRSTSKNYGIQQRVNHLMGRILLASRNREEAVNMWRTVIAGSDRLARARAIYDDTLMMLDDDQITLKEAISEIEDLRYAWRSDEFELTVLQKLASLYIHSGQYRKGLVTMKTAVTHFPNYSVSTVIAKRMNELFAEIFLRDGAEDLPAIDALTLYFEFEELTPVGAKGDAVIQRLADRLVALDLLGRAAELLEHQVKYRLKGVEMARVGTRLAITHLMNGAPENALRALQRSRLKYMPDDLLVQRRHIRSRALADLGRNEDALKRLVGDNSIEAELLRADIFWRAGKWPDVAAATERLLSLAPLKRPLSSFASRHMLRLVVALALADDETALKRLNRLYAAVMRGDPNQQAFDVITSDTGARTASFRELPDAVTRVASFEAFMTSYRERVKNTSLSAIN